jgi:hypothetical protein
MTSAAPMGLGRLAELQWHGVRQDVPFEFHSSFKYQRRQGGAS